MNSKIIKLDFESRWKILTIKGFCDVNHSLIKSIEVYYNKKFIDTLSFGIRFQNKLIGYKGDLLLEDIVGEFDPYLVEVKYVFLQNDSIITDKFVENKTQKTKIGFYDKLFRLYKVVKYRYIINKIFPKRAGIENSIMLFIHNLEYKERIQKLRCFELLDKALKEYGWKLIIVHHSSNILDTDIETIELNNFSLNIFYKIRNIKIINKFSKELDLSVDFLDSLNKSFDKNYLYSMSFDRVYEDFFKTKFLIDRYAPKIVLNWHEWSSLQYMSKIYCESLNIENFNVHEGAIYDTLEVDKVGELAESWIFEDIKEFNNRPLELKDIEVSKKLIKKIKNNNFNRKGQQKKGLIKKLLSPYKNKKIIFFAGVNDSQTGMLPTSYGKSHVHSPVFIDTYDALKYLSKLAHKNDWYILFKPHPNVPVRNSKVVNDRVILVNNANVIECIEETDISVTLLSTLSYDMMIYDKPTVLLGRNLMSSSGSAYEVENLYNVETTILSAFNKEGFDIKQKKYLEHFARLLKYYYFPYSEEAVEYCYRDFSDLARYLIKNVYKG